MCTVNEINTFLDCLKIILFDEDRVAHYFLVNFHFWLEEKISIEEHIKYQDKKDILMKVLIMGYII